MLASRPSACCFPALSSCCFSDQTPHDSSIRYAPRPSPPRSTPAGTRTTWDESGPRSSPSGCTGAGGLTIGALAEHLKLPEYRLRSLIHGDLGYRNFNTLLHQYRVEEVSEALADPARDDELVLTLALSAGYDSISPFNRAFRALKGMTPTQFRARSRQKLADS